MKVETENGELTVRKLTAPEGREMLIYMALINADKEMSLRLKAKNLNDVYTERLCMASGLTGKELGKLDEKIYASVENAYKQMNELGGGEEKDF